MSKVKGYYKIIRLYNNKETETIRENITEKTAKSHCKSKNGKVQNGKIITRLCE